MRILKSISSIHYLDCSLFQHENRGFNKLFQSLLTSSQANLIERLLDQYELNIASNRSITTSSSSDDAFTSTLLQTRFVSPNSGHITQILRCLRDYASVFDNYSIFFKDAEQNVIDDRTSALEIRWHAVLDYLSDDEKKCTAMSHNERHHMSQYDHDASTNMMLHMNHVFNTNHTDESNQQQQALHSRSFNTSDARYIDDDGDNVR
jgi:hypothetical protein